MVSLDQRCVWSTSTFGCEAIAVVSVDYRTTQPRLVTKVPLERMDHQIIGIVPALRASKDEFSSRFNSLDAQVYYVPRAFKRLFDWIPLFHLRFSAM